MVWYVCMSVCVSVCVCVHVWVGVVWYVGVRVGVCVCMWCGMCVSAYVCLDGKLCVCAVLLLIYMCGFFVSVYVYVLYSLLREREKITLKCVRSFWYSARLCGVSQREPC